MYQTLTDIISLSTNTVPGFSQALVLRTDCSYDKRS